MLAGVPEEHESVLLGLLQSVFLLAYSVAMPLFAHMSNRLVTRHHFEDTTETNGNSNPG